MPSRLILIGCVILLCAAGRVRAQSAPSHFEALGRLPSAVTVEQHKALLKALPFNDRRDFDESQRGFIAAPPSREIKGAGGEVVWSMKTYDFLMQGGDFQSIHPSLQRQAVLNMSSGLFEVVPSHLYQVRGFDLANIAVIRGQTGWIVIDALSCEETAAAALRLVNETLGTRPVVAVIYSHSHADHYGGIKGLVDEARVRNGEVQIIAPAGFLDAAVAENVLAGNAMTRRAFYQYGLLLPPSPYGHVDQAIGKTIAHGTGALVAPTRIIERDLQEISVDGVQLVFQLTPGTEAPAEMNLWLPQYKAFFAAENISPTIHNIYTLRGALVRDPLEWSQQINRALYLFGGQAEVLFTAHGWPRWGGERVSEVMRDQRDAYANLNNGVLHLANQGVTINEIHNVYRAPESLQKKWHAHSYHGSEQHNSRAVINRYLGYWDGNPATLIPLSPGESAPLYVEMMGGAKPILAKSRQLIGQGRYLHAVELLNKLVYAQPDNLAAKQLLADAFEQIGYQKESSSLRNSFLAGARELRSGVPTGRLPQAAGRGIIRALPTGRWLDYLGIRLESAKADGLHFVMNLVTPDNGERYVVELSNQTLTNIQGFSAPMPDLTLTINRSDLEKIMTGQSTFAAEVAAGRARPAGNVQLLQRLQECLTDFPPDFAIMPGTRSKTGATTR